MVHALREFLAELWHKYRQDHVSILVSSLAYYAFFSFFPMLLLIASILGFLFGMGGPTRASPPRCWGCSRSVRPTLPARSTRLFALGGASASSGRCS